jgi:hypothetical protein
MGNQQKQKEIIHLQIRFQWAKRDYRHSIFIERIAQIYEQNLKIDTLDENLLLDLHKMWDNIGNKCHSF